MDWSKCHPGSLFCLQGGSMFFNHTAAEFVLSKWPTETLKGVLSPRMAIFHNLGNPIFDEISLKPNRSKLSMVCAESTAVTMTSTRIDSVASACMPARCSANCSPRLIRACEVFAEMHDSAAPEINESRSAPSWGGLAFQLVGYPVYFPLLVSWSLSPGLNWHPTATTKRMCADLPWIFSQIKSRQPLRSASPTALSGFAPRQYLQTPTKFNLDT